MEIKKNFFAPLALGLGATRRVALLLLVMMLTTATAWATDKTLSGSESYTAQDGDVLTGSTSGTVTIAADAKITLSDVTITGGIVCAGTATITLVGTNSVSGATNKAGIQVGGSDTKLTIKGNGSLTANGGNQSAGIGLSRAWNPANDVIGGNIVIEGGTIIANGSVNGQWGAGIGTGVIKGGTATLGTITIKGGSVKATGGSEADGIGTGYTYNGCTNAIGTVTIYDGIDMVDASSIKNSGSIVYKHEENDVTANASTYFTIIEDGSRRVIFPKDDTDYTITIADGIEHGTIACEATTAKLGANVTITATPDQGYIFSRLVVKDAQNNDVESTGNSFIMPKSNVSVSAIFAEGSYNGTCGNGVYYAYDSSTKTLTISGSGVMTDYNDVSERPWNSYASDIQKVVIGAGVTSIGGYAFMNCPNLATVTVYAPSCTLGDNAFLFCNNLANIYVFNDLVDDYQAAWSTYATKITGITGGYCGTTDHERDVVWALTGKSPNCTLTISGEGAMYDYGNPTEYPWYSYAGKINEVVIGNGVTSIGKYAFDGTALTSIEIPASVTSIGEYAFSGSSLGSVTFAEGSQLTSIGDGAFASSDLTSITIPASVTSIGEDVFLNCNNLASMAVADGNTVYDSRNGCNAIIEKSTNTLIIGCKNSTIPASVTSIGDYAFGATGLTSIEIPASVTSIGGSAFGATGLTSVEIPASVTSIGRCAFLNCPNLATVTVYAPSCSLGEDAFADCGSLANIYVFGDKVASYKAATNWSAYTEKITALPTVTTSYVDADGTLHEGVEAVPLNNAMTTLSAGWYVVNSDITYTGTITLNGDVNIILADGKTMSVVPTTAGYGIFGYNDINGESYDLTIYGQTGQSGTLAATTSGVAGPNGLDGTPGYAIYVGGYTQHGGIVTLNTSGGIATCISAEADVTITRGTLTANTTATYSYGLIVMGNLTITGGSVTANATGDSDSYGISVLNKPYWDGVKWVTVPATLTFSSGNVEASSIYMDDDDDGGTINLSWTSATDRFKVTEYVNGTITIADGKTFHNGSEPLSGTVTDKTKLNGKTLTPPTYSVTANRAKTEDTEYWSTFYHPAAGYTADENTTVYQAAVNTTTNKVELTAVPGREIPADKAVVLKSTQSAIMLSRATTTQTLDGNELKGGSTVADGTVPYTLAAKDGTVGFYKFVGAALNPNKAHLEITAPAQSAPAFLGFEENTTAINEHELHESHELSGAWYTLDGRKLQGKPSAKGIYVRNGRKFIIK